MKALRNKFRVGIVVQLVVLGLLSGSATSCGTTAKASNEPLVEHSDARTDDEILYASVLDAFAEAGLDVELSDPERGIVLTTWTEVNREVRHRWVGRVIRSAAGLVLKVDSAFERRESVDSHTVWVEADDPYTLREKVRDEEKMGAAIQKRFWALGGTKR